MYFNTSKLALTVILMLVVSLTAICQPSARISGVSHGRPGYSAGLSLEIVRGGIIGPVRIKLDLPKSWKAKSYGFDKRATLEELNGQTTILWLSLPVLDTVKYSFDVRIPDSQPIQPEVVRGVLEYFNSEGKKMSIPISSHQLKMMRYFSRYQ